MVKRHLATTFPSKDKFLHYVDIHNKKYRGHSASLSDYLSLIRRYRATKEYVDLLSDSSHIGLVYKTLEEWNMNQRGAILFPLEKFKLSIMENKGRIAQLSQYRLELLQWKDLIPSVFPELKYLFANLNVMASASKIVGVSKTLHFLLPDLVMPIDGKYTLAFFYDGRRYSHKMDKEFGYFKEIFEESLKLARDLKLSVTDVDGIGWNTSVPKMIDNAIIAFAPEL